MKHIALADSSPRRLAFYLAMEEWVARSLPDGDYFFSWRVNPTVICGRNQEIDKEVALDYCRAEGIDVVRRRSGGGCVYADMDNLMFSYITATGDVEGTFSRYTTMVAEMLGSLGFEAHATGRNDIFIGDRKVAGNAFYRLPRRSIVHGTMLIDIDAERMIRAITPSRAKLESKSVKSVPARVTCLKTEGYTGTVSEFEKHAIAFLTGGDTIVLSAGDVAEIEAIEQTYYDPAWLRPDGRSAGSTRHKPVRRNVRIEGVGEFTIYINVDADGRMSRVDISGDFFPLDDLSGLCGTLSGCPYRRADIDTALAGTEPGKFIAGLTREALADALID